MSTKEIITGLLDRLPEDISLRELAREIDFIAAVREGFESYEREGGVSIDQAKEKVSLWSKAATSAFSAKGAAFTSKPGAAPQDY